MAFRWRPRPKGKNVIPFPSDRVKPPSGRSLSDIEPKPPINLEEIRRQKALQEAADIMPEGGLSGIEEPPKKFKGVHEAIKDLSESMKKFNERHAPLLEREGLSGSKKNISSLEDQQLFILNRERMTPEQRAMRERDDEVILNELETLDIKILSKRHQELRSNLNKLLSEDPRSDKKNSQGLPLTKTRIAVDKHYLDLIVNEIKRREEGGLSGLKDRKATQDVIEIPAKTDTDKYIRERITNPDQPKLAGDELQKEIMKFTEGHSGNEDIISVLQRQIDDISDIGLPANREKLSQIYVRTVDKGGFKVLTINRKADDVIMGLVYPSLKGDTMIWQASPTMKRKSLVTWTPLGKTEGDYDLVTAQGKPITRRESGFQNVGEVTVTDPKKRGRSVMEGLRVMLNYMEHEMQYYYDKSQGLNPTWTDPELNK